MTAPALKVQVQGVTTVSADNFNTFQQTCDTAVSELGNFVGLQGMQVYARGLNALGDGGQGIFYWATGSYTNDGVNTIVPPGANNGAWLRLTTTSGSNTTFVTSITALRQISADAASSLVLTYVITGTLTGTIFQWSPTSSAEDNGTTIIEPNGLSGNGRWIASGITFPVAGGISVTTGHLCVGNAPDLYQPSDDIAGIEAVSSGGTNDFIIAATGIGTNSNPAIHTNKADGTLTAPTPPLAGESLGTFGGRAFDSVTNTWAVSSVAMNWYLSENARSGTVYSGSYGTLETTMTGGGQFRRPVLLYTADGSILSPGTSGLTGTSPPTLGATGTARFWYGDQTGVGGAVQSNDAVGLYMNRNTSVGEIIEFRQANVTVGNISVSGSATAYNTSSDTRLKTDLGLFTVPAKIFDSVSPHHFIWNATNQKDFGFFAQELYKVVPEAVHVGSDVGPGEEGFSPWAVDNSKLVPILWAEIQSLRARVLQLENK